MNKTKCMALFMSLALVFGGCGSMNNTGKGALIGGGSGAAIGAVVGGLIGHGKGAAIGAVIGTAVGGTTGALIGKKMDKKAAEAAKVDGAQVTTITDSNGLKAVKVTFDSGILFDFNSAALKANAKKSLSDFAKVLNEDATLDIAIIGHTDKVGTEDANMKVSQNRANAVSSYLKACRVSSSQFKSVEGVGFSQYDESLTAAQNRNVEVYMYASEQMIKDAQSQANGK